MLLSSPTSSEWSISIAKDGFGKIVQGEDDINQSLNILLLTSKGTDPLRPLFGCDALKQMDMPINKVKSTMTKNILEAIDFYEKRVTVTSITSRINGGQISFLIKYTIVNSTNTGQTNVTYGLNQ